MPLLRRSTNKVALVADDDAEVLAVVETILEQEGFQVTTARDGREALKRLKKQRFDLLVLDVRMPKLSGIHLLRAVKSSATHRETPVLLLTAWPLESLHNEKERRLASMAEAYVLKPFNVAAFVNRIRILTQEHGNTRS